MSQQSSKRRKAQPRKEGHRAPPTLADRVGHLEAYLRDLPPPVATPLQSLQNLETLSKHNYATTTLGASPKPPTIKSRLEALIDHAELLNNRLDTLSNTIVGDGSPASTSASTPLTILDQLEQLEYLLANANERLLGLSDRF